jgi:uncharacterized protein YuzE
VLLESEVPESMHPENEDIIHIKIKEEKEGTETSSVELSPNITAELDVNDEIIGVEILDASRYLRDTILDTVQAKLLLKDGIDRK